MSNEHTAHDSIEAIITCEHPDCMALLTFTRKQYLAGDCTHDEYYGQFVNAHTLRYIGRRFDANELSVAYAKDRHLNSIPLAVWDALSWAPADGRRYSGGDSGPFHAILPFNRHAIEAAGEQVTRATLVCIAKRASRMIIDAGEVDA